MFSSSSSKSSSPLKFLQQKSSLLFVVVIILSLLSLLNNNNNQNNGNNFFSSSSIFVEAFIPTCSTLRPVTAASLRETDTAGVLIHVFGDPTNVGFVPGPVTTKYLNSNLTHSSNAQRSLEIVGAALLNSTSDVPPDNNPTGTIAIVFKAIPDFVLGTKNETITIHLPSYFFWNGVPCPQPFNFTIVPAAGSLDIQYVPSFVTEIEINDGDVSFAIYVNYDKFISTDFFLVNPPNFTVTAALGCGITGATPIESRRCDVMTVTVQKKPDYNPAVGHEDKVVLIYNKYMMESGVAPLIGDGIAIKEVAIPFRGVEPVATVQYQTAAGALLSEDLWDGIGWVSVQLKGDNFVLNDTLWIDPAFQPTYVAAKPKSPFGFDYFFTQYNMRPDYNITERSVNLTFPPLVGFTIPSVVDQMRINDLGRVTQEGRFIDAVPVRVLRVADSSPTINFTGTPFTGSGVNEVGIRRNGINISLIMKYNVWVDPPAKGSYTTMIRSITNYGSTDSLSFLLTAAKVVNLTRLDIYVPPQIAYDISVDELFNITVWTTMTETRQLIVNNSRIFVISQFTGASTCKLNYPSFVKESDIRNTSGPAITFQVDIIFGADSFCFSSQSDQELRQSMTVATGSGNPEQMVNVIFAWNTSSNMSMRIEKDPSFEITANVFLSMVLPPNLMCSMEICQADGSGSTNSAKLRLPIGATAGELIGTMPRVSEAFMRTKVLVAYVDFVGDAFVLSVAGATRGDIPLTTTVTPIDSRGRGFDTSFPQDVLNLYINGNETHGLFRLPPNASFDIVNEETITFTVVSVRTASQLPPLSKVIPLRIYPLLGELNVTYPAMTPPPPVVAGTTTMAATTTGAPYNCSANCTNTTTEASTTSTTTTTTIATTTTTGTTSVNGTSSNTTNTSTPVALIPWMINVTESSILNGSLVINMTLTNDRFDTAILPSVLRAHIELQTAVQASGILFNREVTFANDAFWFDRNEFTMSIRMKPTPNYDITKPESFTLIFNGSVLVSRANPTQNKLTINVDPDPGILTMTGRAMLLSSFEIVNGFQSYVISLEGDKFVTSPVFNMQELCVVTGGACEVTLDKSRRNITVTYDPAPDFFISRNQTYEIKLQKHYFDSQVLPVGFRNVTIYLSGGKLQWFMALNRVSEDEVRSGSYTGLSAEKPIATAALSGDLFAALEDVRRALATSVSCVSADKKLTGLDPYGFCARAKNLFGSVFFKVRNERFIDVVLQPDDQFDVYAEETVNLVVGGGATQSRLAPVVPGKQGTITVYPTQGKYFISTSFVQLNEQDISNAALASKVRLSISLYGERWLTNVTRVVELVVNDMSSSRGTREINGWERYRGQIIPAQTAGKTDATSRLFEVQFVAAPKYNVFNPEIISVKVPAGSVLSPFSPALASVQAGFTIDIVGGFLSGSPTEVTTKTIQNKGFNITLVLRQAFWNQLPLLEFKNIDPEFSSDKVPQEEPNGFTVHREKLLSLMAPAGALPLNTSHVVFMIAKVPNYEVITPEKIRINVPLTWVQGGENGKPLTPPYFEVRVMPEFPFVEAVVYSKIDLTSNSSTYLIEAWKKAVAEKLAVIAPRIVVELVEKEWMVPDSAPYYRIRFKVTNTDPTIPYDNTVTRLFISMDREFLENNFNTSFAFFNASPPEIKLWNTLEGAAGALAIAEATGLGIGYIGWFILAILVALFIIWLVRRYNQGKHKNDLNWGESEGRVKADARFTDTHEMEEQNFDKAAELLFAGQGAIMPYLADDTAADAARKDADRAAIARKHGIVQDNKGAIVHAGTASAAGHRLKTMRPTSDGRDELAFFDVPDNLYSGQSSVQKRATDADVGMALIDRMVTSGTDHSTRISKSGASRLSTYNHNNNNDLIGTGAAAAFTPRHEFVSPTTQKQRDPTLFGSEKRINALLDKVAPSDARSGYLTDLRGKLIESGTTPMNKKEDANDAASKLWNDNKADEVVIPPHLVGKASRFRPPSSRG